MAIASVEVIPYALPFREPYVTARGTLERREMVLLRLRDEDGVEGLGEAVPLSLRGGRTLARGRQRAAATRRSGRDRELDRGAALAATRRALLAARRASLALLDRSRVSRRACARARRRRDRGASPVRCNATLVAGEPAGSPPRPDVGGRRLHHLQAQGRKPARRRSGARRCARRSARGARSGSTPTAPGTPADGRADPGATARAARLELAEQPCATPRGDGRAARGDVESRSPPTRASPAAEDAHGAPPRRPATWRR